MTDTASDLQRDVDAFRSRLIAMDRQASQVLSATYSDTLSALQPRLDALDSKIAARIKAGEAVNPSWLFQQDRYRELIGQTNTLMAQYGQVTGTVTTAAQQAAIKESLAEAGRQLATVSGGSPEIARLSAGWASIPDASIQNMVGALQKSTPLGQLLGAFGSDAVKDVNRALLRGMSLGLGADETTRAVQLALGITRARAEMIVRTETLRATNASLIAAFEESGVVKGWRWCAALSARTCGACLSRHGKVYPLTTPMERHVQCRCVASPYLGNGDDDEWESGDAWLKRQPLATQQAVLGKEGSSLFNAGQLRLEDFQRRTVSKAWGASVSDGGVTWAKQQAAKAGRAVGGGALPISQLPETSNIPRWPAGSPPPVIRPTGFKPGSGPWDTCAESDLACRAASVRDFMSMKASDADLIRARVTQSFYLDSRTVYDRWLQTNTDASIAANVYYGFGHRAMNNVSRAKPTPPGLPSMATPVNIKYVEDLDAAIARDALTLSEPVKVYRGIASDRIDADLQVGNEVTDWGFMSTTLDPRTALGFSSNNTTMEVVLPKGTRAIHADGKGPVDENELLLPRGSTIRVLEVQEGKTDTGANRHVIAELLLPVED